jgi:hypothetical protein
MTALPGSPDRQEITARRTVIRHDPVLEGRASEPRQTAPIWARSAGHGFESVFTEIPRPRIGPPQM